MRLDKKEIRIKTLETHTTTIFEKTLLISLSAIVLKASRNWRIIAAHVREEVFSVLWSLIHALESSLGCQFCIAA
jgi:hypothetical protein